MLILVDTRPRRISQSSFKIKDESSIDHRIVCHLPNENGKKLRNNFVHLPREKVDSGRTLGRTKSADKKRVKRYFKRDVTNSLLFCFELQRYATARPAGSPVTNSIAQQSAAFESDRYQIRQMVEMSQISPTFGTFTKFLSNYEIL